MTPRARPVVQSFLSAPRPDQTESVHSPGRQVVRLADCGDLVSAVPYLMGFVPRRSLVLVSLRGPRLSWGLTARADLPRDQVRFDVTALADQLVERVCADGPRELVAVVYDDLPWVTDPRPWAGLVEAVRVAAKSGGTDLREAVYVGAERFWSFSCTVATCCPPTGRLISSTRGSPAAAAFVFDGVAPARVREEVEARLRPGGPSARAAVRSMSDDQMRGVLERWSGKDLEGQSRWGRAVVDLFGEVVHRYTVGGTSVGASEAARLLVGLAVTGVRDDVITKWTNWLQALPDGVGDPKPGAVPPGVEERSTGDAVERLLVDLVRCATITLSVAPLTLLSLDCWARGDGGLANIAIDRALSADPTYRLALLADQLLRAGIAPAWASRRGEAGPRPPGRLDM